MGSGLGYSHTALHYTFMEKTAALHMACKGTKKYNFANPKKVP
jgi:hypothetical protein